MRRRSKPRGSVLLVLLVGEACCCSERSETDGTRASASEARAAAERVSVVFIEQWMYIGSGGGVSFSLPLVEGGEGGGGRRRDVERGFEGGRRAPDAIRRMVLVR